MKKQDTYSAWGNYPKLIGDKQICYSESFDLTNNKIPLISQGNLRSYGDSALSKNPLSLLNHNKIISFNDITGVLHCQTGILLRKIIEEFLEKGWFLPICPGTQDITLGGAIASDVHGKNHYKVGTFSECLLEFSLINGNKQKLICSKTNHSDWFHASCGGMGLTGIITDAKIQLKKVESSFINQRTIKTKNLSETFEKFEQHKDANYSVAWIDCLAKEDKTGRGILKFGEFSKDKKLTVKRKNKLTLPFYLPSSTLTPLSLKLFNTLYYHRLIKTEKLQKVHYQSFFFPLDGIQNWNRFYGKHGFLQYQFVLPLENSFEGMENILTTVSKSKQGSPLSCTKTLWRRK